MHVSASASVRNVLPHSFLSSVRCWSSSALSFAQADASIAADGAIATIAPEVVAAMCVMRVLLVVQVLLRGTKKGHGILCSCCKEIVSLSGTGLPWDPCSALATAFQILRVEDVMLTFSCPLRGTPWGIMEATKTQ